MSSLEGRIKEFEKEISSSNLNLAASLLETIYVEICGGSYDNNDFNYIPGQNFSYFHPEATREIYDRLFSSLLSNDSFMEQNSVLCSNVISQIAAFDFSYFVESNYPQLIKPNDKIRRIFAIVSRTIVDPFKGFLCYAPKTPNNDCWHDENYKYDFFSDTSPDLQTTFGIALSKVRNRIYSYFLTYTGKLINFYKGKKIDETVFVPSFANMIQNIIVPQAYRLVNISCGFPTRLEVLYAISQSQDFYIFAKSKSDHFNHTKQIAQKYSEMNAKISGFPSIFSDDLVKFSHPFSFADDIDIKICKLLPFLAINEYEVSLPQFFNLIVYIEPIYAGFFLSLAQLFYMSNPSFAFLLIDDIINQNESLSNLTPEQSHTLFHMISRLVDVLGCLPTRYIEDEQIEKLNALGLLGLASSLPRIRYAAYKLIETLSHFEAGEDKIPLYQILQENSGFFEEHLLNHLEKDPMILMSCDVLAPLVPLSMMDALTSIDWTLWQYIYSAIGIYAAENFSETLLTSYKKMAISFVKNGKNNSDNRVKWTIINTLTFLAAVAETPLSNFSEKSTIPLIQQLTNDILDELLSTIKQYIKTSYPIIRVLLSPLNISSFQAFLNMMNDSVSPEIIALVLRSISWNSNFSAISEHEEFFSIFLDLFIKNINSFDWGDLNKEIVQKITEKHYKNINGNWIFVSESLMTAYKLFSALYHQQKRHAPTPFPFLDHVFNTNNSFIKKIQPLFYLLYNLARLRSSHNRLQTYAITTLSQWAACCEIEDKKFLLSDTFFVITKNLTKTSPDLLVHLLSHHFEILFGLYLQWAIQPGGSQFFIAIFKCFTASSLSQNTTLIDILKTQWSSCTDVIEKSSSYLKYLQVIYENCGLLILCCLFYMNIPELKLTEQAFVLLASLVPVLISYHMNGRPDEIPKLFKMFIEESKKLEQNGGCMDYITLLGISKNLSESFAFCMEALLNSTFDLLPRNSQEIVDHTLYILMPWFDSIEFDLENRVISNQTELLFLHFSCYSFIDKLMTSFKDFSSLDINSSFFDLWKALITSNDEIGPNFLPIELSILYDCKNSINHETAIQIMRYMYRVVPNEVVSILCSYLSLNEYFYDHIQDLISFSNSTEFKGGNDASHLLAEEYEESSKKNDLFLFIYQALGKLVVDSYRPIIPHVPLIFASCVIFLNDFIDVVKELILNILNAFKTFINKESSHMLNEAIQTIQSLSVVHKHLIDNAEITRDLTNFLISYDQQMALDFGHELLKWGLCCGDLKLATSALRSYSGNLIDCSMLVIGLISRSMWMVSDAIPILYNANENVRQYTKYLATALNLLGSMTPNKCTASDLVVLWLALSSLERNSSIFKEVFDSALNLLTLFLTPQNFAALAGIEAQPQIPFFSPSSFYRFHQPWGDVYHGALTPILTYKGNANVDLMILVINKIIQTQYIKLLSDSPCGIYTAILAILPWIWYVATNEISRFLFDSFDVQMLEMTVNSMDPFIENKELVGLLSTVYLGEDVDIYAVIDTIAEMVIPLVDDTGINEIGQFYTTCVKYTAKSYHVPVYSFATKMLKLSPDKEKTAASFAQLTKYMAEDSKASRQINIDVYLKELPPAFVPLYRIKTSDSQLYRERLSESQLFREKSSDSPLFRVESNDIFLRDKSSESPLNREYSEPTILNDTEENNESTKIEFPDVSMYERVVAMNIPHLYDINVNEVQVANFDDLNSFPPLLPNNTTLSSNEKFSSIITLFKKFKCEPFSTYAEILNKLHTSLVDIDSLYIVKLCDKITSFPINRIFNDALNEIMENEVPLQEVEEEEVFEQPEEIVDDFVTIADDPYEFIMVLPNLFVPTVDEINSIGIDLMDGIERF